MNKVISQLIKKGFTQAQIACLAGMSQTSISRIVSGKTKSIKFDKWKRLNDFVAKLDKLQQKGVGNGRAI